MILHKYLDKFGFETLSSLELKFNIPSKFNDPFEFLPKPINDWTRSNIKNTLNQKIFKTLFILI